MDVPSPTVERSWRQRLRVLLSHDADPLTQFIKYVAVGCVAAGTHYSTVIAVAHFWLPVTEATPWNFTIANCIAFVISGTVAYLANIRWVFKSGRHSRAREIFLFFGVALFAFLIGTPLGQFLVNRFNLVDKYWHIAQLAAMSTSVLVNFVCRKFLIFAR